jgi:protein SCO1/2
MQDRLFGTRGLKFSRYIHCVALMWVLNGCDTHKQWQLHDITGHLPNLRFSLISDAKQPVTNLTYHGYVVLLFFGFTGCHAECSATMFRLAKISQRLGESANRTRILFVTLDPGRDTPEVLHHYLTAFDFEHTIGLTGSEDEIEDLVKRYRAAYRPRETNSDDITHSTAVYIFDPRGRARLLVTPEDTIETVTNDLQLLLESSQ